MSNPAVYVLGETQIRNVRVRIEDNLGESIHVHIGDFRITLSVKEFYAVVEQFQKAADELLAFWGMKIDMFDYRAFDWDWFGRYENMSKIEKVHVKISDLLTKGESAITPNIDVIIPVSESRQYRALCGDDTQLCRYKEKNVYGQSNMERLSSVMDCIKREYPYDDKYIIVNQFNQIYDGDHRAACLLYLRGADASIPVIQITFDNELTIEEQLNNQERLLNDYLEKEKNRIKPVYNWSEDTNVLDLSFVEFRTEMESKGIDYYYLDHFWSDVNGEIVADKVVIVRPNSMIDFCHEMKISYYGKSIYRRFGFLYSMQRAVYIELNDIKVLVLDRLACKSKFENALMPLDKYLQIYADGFYSTHLADTRMLFVYVIINAIINGNGFTNAGKTYIQDNVWYLKDEDTMNLLEKVFFGYTEKLVEMLINQNYNGAYEGYVTNTDY